MRSLPVLPLLPLMLSIAIEASIPLNAQAGYWLVLGSYRQGPGGRPEVSGITSPSIHAIPMDTLEECQIAGRKIANDIYKPVWQFDSRWTCVWGGKSR